MHTVIAVAALVAVLAFAVVRPRGLPEALVAVPVALAVVALGVLRWSDAGHELVTLGPTLAFLAAVLVLAYLADREGVFRYAGALAARAARGRPPRLLGMVFLLATVVTAVLSLDATVVLLTPVVFATATGMGVRTRPHVYACTHLANSASLLLPVSNLTNLLAYPATGLSFAGFAALMAAPLVVAVAAEYLVFRKFFAADLGGRVRAEPAEPVPAPRFALAVLSLTLPGFALAQPLGIHPAWVAGLAAVVLAVRYLIREPRAAGRLAAELNPLFLAFVAALSVVVLAVSRTGLGTLVGALAPHRATLLGLAGAALLAAVLANLLNNLPATLMLVPVVGHAPGLVLAVLLGVNIGPNLTYVGSLATLLWRQLLHARDQPPGLGDFLRLGALTVPLALAGAVLALWLGLTVSGVA